MEHVNIDCYLESPASTPDLEEAWDLDAQYPGEDQEEWGDYEDDSDRENQPTEYEEWQAVSGGDDNWYDNAMEIGDLDY